MIIADTVFVNGKVATVDKQFSFQRAVAVKDGWIIEVGQDSDVKKYIGPDTKVIDLNGKLLMPGAHDAHTHGVSWGTTLASCNCGYPDVNTIDDLRNVLKSRVRQLRPGEWLRGEGLNQDALEAVCGRRVTRLDVDDVTPDNPVIIQDCTGHAAFANGKAMEIAGITAQTPEPDGGAIGRLPNGEPDGMFYEAGGTCLVMSHVPLWTEEELRTSILTTQRILNENGYTSYTESTVGPANDLRESGRAGSRAIYIYKQLHDEGKLTCRVAMGFYSGKNGFQSAELTVVLLDGVWRRGHTLSFERSASAEGGDFLDLPYDLPYDLGPRSASGLFSSSEWGEHPVRLVVHGPCANPAVRIDGNVHRVDVAVYEGCRLVVDPLARTVSVVDRAGGEFDVFPAAHRGEGLGSGEYIFEPAGPGRHEVGWDGSFRFDLTWYEEEGEPPWS